MSQQVLIGYVFDELSGLAIFLLTLPLLFLIWHVVAGFADRNAKRGSGSYRMTACPKEGIVVEDIAAERDSICPSCGGQLEPLRRFRVAAEVRIRLETEAKLRIQERVVAGEIELAWSYILDYESAANPFEERRAAVGSWRRRSVVDVSETPQCWNMRSPWLRWGSTVKMRSMLPAQSKLAATTSSRQTIFS
jgi:hypothetical protein